MKKNFVVKMALLVCSMMLFSGCSAISEYFSGEKPVVTPQIETPDNPKVDESFKVIIRDFCKAVYSEPLEVSFNNSVMGLIPASIDGIISDTTKKENANTPQLPIHYPRFIELNGLTCVGYEILAPDVDINARFYESKPDNISFAYLVDVKLRAKVVKNDDFGKYFRYNDVNHAFDKLAEIPEEDADYIKITARYDVLVENISGVGKKIKSAVESTTKSNERRLNKINNEFVKRISYFNFADKKEKDEFDSETNLAKEFISKMMLAVSKERLDLITPKWNRDPKEFADYLESIKLLKNENGEDYLFNVLDNLTYKNRFDIKLFPIRPGIQKINGFVNMEVNEHPSFTEKQRNYRVLAVANVERTEGIVGTAFPYVYEYTVGLIKSQDKTFINSISLNRFNMERK